jgi:hypothetical protein
MQKIETTAGAELRLPGEGECVQDEYVVQPSTIRPRFFREDGGEEESVKVYLDGLDGGPDAVVVRHSDQARGSRHFHHGSQFQFTVEGAMEFHHGRLDAPAVHYTDHNTAYGPFSMLDDHRMLVLHARPAGQVFLDERGSSAERNRDGRTLSARAAEMPWDPVPGVADARRRVLLDPASGPGVQIVEAGAGAPVAVGDTTYGRFEFVLDGEVMLDGQPLEAETLRFTRGRRAFAPLIAGPAGATVAVLSFDEDATRGERGGISIADRVAQFAEIGAADATVLKVND